MASWRAQRGVEEKRFLNRSCTDNKKDPASVKVLGLCAELLRRSVSDQQLLVVVADHIEADA